MSIGTGSKSTLLFAEEATYGVRNTAVASGAMTMFYNSESLTQTINTINSELLRPDRKMPSIRGGNLSAGGDITTELQAGALIVPMRHLMLTDAADKVNRTAIIGDFTPWATGGDVEGGTLMSSQTASHLWIVTKGGVLDTTEPTGAGTVGVTVVDGTAEYTYLAAVANVGNYTLYSYPGGATCPDGGLSVVKTVDKGATDSNFNFLGGRVNSLRIEVPQEGIVGATFGMLFQQSTSDEVALSGQWSAANTIDHAEDPMAGYDCVLTAATVGSSFAGANVLPYVQSANLEIMNNFDESPFAIGSRVRRGLPEGRRESRGSLTVFFEDQQEYDWFANETVLGLKFSFSNASSFFNVTFPEVKLTGSGTPQIGGQGVITASFDFTAFYQGNGVIDTDAIIDVFTTNAEYDLLT